MPHTFQTTAEGMIRLSGGRMTSGRVNVLAVLLSEQQAITHREIAQRLPGKTQLDRVTLYRVLEWLYNNHLIHKVISDDRVWRFHSNHRLYLHQHAHFKCTSCAQVICLDNLPAEHDWSLPSGYQFQEIELTVKGLCSKCV